MTSFSEMMTFYSEYDEVITSEWKMRNKCILKVAPHNYVVLSRVAPVFLQKLNISNDKKRVFYCGIDVGEPQEGDIIYHREDVKHLKKAYPKNKCFAVPCDETYNIKDSAEIFKNIIGYEISCFKAGWYSLVECLIEPRFKKNLLIFKNQEYANFVKRSISGGYVLKDEKNDDDYITYDVNSMYGTAMLYKFPFGGYRFHEQPTDKVLERFRREERLGFIEISIEKDGDGFLMDFKFDNNNLAVITSIQYFDCLRAGYELKIHRILEFQYADNFLEEPVRRVYNLRSSHLYNKYGKKAIVQFSGKTMKKEGLLKIANCSAPLYIGSFILYRSKQILRTIIDTACLVRPNIVNVDAFTIKKDLVSENINALIGTDIGQLKIVS